MGESPHPLGSAPGARRGRTFRFFLENATGAELLLFRRHDDADPFLTIQLDPYVNKTFHFWPVYVRNLPPGTHYGYRVDGPSGLSAGHRFNRRKVLIDPEAIPMPSGSAPTRADPKTMLSVRCAPS